MSETRTAEYVRRVEALRDEPLVAIATQHGTGVAAEMRRVWKYRELLDLLIRRELKVRYKDSSLGFLWTLIRPLAMLAVYYFALGKFLGAQKQIPDFALFLFAGLTLWTFFTEIVAGCTGCILGNSGLVKKVDLPLETFPFAVVGSALFNFAVQMVILLLGCLALGKFPLGIRWAYAPMAMFVALTWGLGLGMIMAAVNVYMRDVQYLVEIGLTIWFWVCPIVYKFDMVVQVVGHPLLQNVYLLNPMAVASIGFQKTFWVAGTGEPVPSHLGIRLMVFGLLGLLLCWIGQRIFSRLAGNFAQEL